MTDYPPSTLPELAKKLLQEHLTSPDPTLLAFKHNSQIFNPFELRGGLNYTNTLGYLTVSATSQLVEYDFQNAYPTIARIIAFNTLIREVYEGTLVDQLVFYEHATHAVPLNQKVQEYRTLTKQLRKRPLTPAQMKRCLRLFELEGKLYDRSLNELLEGQFVFPISEFIRLLSTQLNAPQTYTVKSLVYYSGRLATNPVFLTNEVIDALPHKKFIYNTVIGQTRHYCPFLYGQITSLMRLLLQSTIHVLERQQCAILQANTDNVVFLKKSGTPLPSFEPSLKFRLKARYHQCYTHNKTYLISQPLPKKGEIARYQVKAMGKDLATPILEALQTQSFDPLQLKPPFKRNFRSNRRKFQRVLHGIMMM